jgi:hypothetical protein
MLISVVLFLFVSMTIILGVVSPILKQATISKNIITSKGSFYLSEAGVEDVLYRLKNGKQVAGTETLTLNGGTASTITTTVPAGKIISTTGDTNTLTRKIQVNLILGTGIAFHYGVQAGNGGFTLTNSSSITGNVYSAGPVTGSGNMIYGDVVSTGLAGLVKGIHATGTVYAHTLGGASAATIVDRDAYYQTITNTTVTGTSHPGSTDMADTSLPISDAQIEAWKSDAVAGGVMASSACDSYSAASNTCTISSTMSLGPKKIPFNLLIKSSSGVLTVTGPLWVVGNITAQTGPTIRMSPSLGGTNVAVIADDPANSQTKGLIDIGQSTLFQGSGTVGSFVFMISQNNSAENGGSTNAITMSQGAAALVAYASHGQITLSQSVSLKEVTAYRIVLTQSANVTYDTGLPSTVFASGPAGGYDISAWQEI